MPTYAYACTECDHRFDIVQSFSDDALTSCPNCGGRLRKVFNAVGVVFKGSGFYRTDSRGSERGGDGSKDGAAKEGGGAGRDGSSGSDGAAGSEAAKTGAGADGAKTGAVTSSSSNGRASSNASSDDGSSPKASSKTPVRSGAASGKPSGSAA